MRLSINLNVLLFILILLGLKPALAGIGLTYQGRIIKPDGSTLASSNVRFTVQILSPNDCLLYKETHYVDMSAGNGVFSLNVGSDPGHQNFIDPSGPLSTVFTNRGVFSGLTGCTGNVYSPNSDDNRKILVGFEDLNSPGSGVELIPVQTVAYIPFAVESYQISGFTSNNLLRVGDGNVPALTVANFNDLLQLINGNSNKYVQAASAGVSSITAGAGLSGGTINSTGTIAIADTGVTAGTYGSATEIPTFTVNSRGQLISAGNITISGTAPGGSAGGDLTGSYPNPGIKASAVDEAKLATDAVTSAKIKDGEIVNADISGSAAIADSKLATISSAGKVANSATTGTSANTGNTLVLRDTTGNFAAGNITANQSNTNETYAKDLYVRNAGNFSVKFNLDPSASANFNVVWPTNTASAGKVLGNDGNGNLSWVSSSAGSVTQVTSANADIGVANTTSAPVLTLNSGSVGGAGDANKIAKLDGSGLLAPAMVPSLDASKIGTGVLPIARGGTNSGATLNNDSAMVSSGGAIVESSVTSTELGYLSGVTSSIQTQLGSKASSGGWANFGVIGTNGSGAMTAVTGSVNGSVLQYSATGPIYSTASYPSTTTANQLLYSSADNVVGGLATTNNAVLTTNGSGVPSWSPLSNDVFSQYALLAGRTGGQALNGGTAASNSLTLDSTSNSTKGYVLINPTGGNVGVGTNTPTIKLDVAGAVRVGTDATACAAGIAGAIRYNSIGNNVEYCNGSVWTAFSAGGAGVTSLNGLNANTQTFAIGTDGTAPAFNSGGSIHTLNIPMANTALVTAGLISKAEYDTFNAKLGTATSFSGDVNGTYNATSVDKIKGKTISPVAYAPNQVLRYNGTNWVNAAIDAATDLTGVVGVSNGGTGVNSLGSGNLLVGNGTSAVTTLAAGAAGNVLYASGLFTWASGTPDTAGLLDKSSPQVVTGSKSFTSFVQMNQQNALRFADSDSSHYVALRSPATVSSNITFTLPDSVGANGQSLITDGLGGLTWGSPSPGVLNDLGDVYVNTVNNSMFMGPGTKQSGTSGNNLGIGIRTLGAVTSGSENVALGVDAMPANTTGFANVAVGWYSLNLNTTGGNNTAVGNESMSSNNNGFSNTGVGSFALLDNISGSENTGLGESSLSRNTTGAKNVGVGVAAGMYNKTGNSNTSVGYLAAYGTVGASDFNNITVVGFEAGKALRTGGDGNVLLGYRAGDQLTTGSKNIVIGYDIDTPTVTTSNSLNIGNLIFGTGLDGLGTTLSTGNVGIGTSSPSAKLQVQGAIVSTTNPIAAGAAVNLATSNTHTLASVGGSTITLSNMVDGGTYTLILTDTTSRTYTFSGCTTSYFRPANAATTAATRTIYGIVTIKNGANWDCYINWTSGYQ